MVIIETCPICGHDLIDTVLCTYPPRPHKNCPYCGWSWTGEPEEVKRVPFGGNSNYETYRSNAGNIITLRNPPMTPSDIFYKAPPCHTCSNNPANGGSGICNCVLGGLDMQIT